MIRGTKKVSGPSQILLKYRFEVHIFYWDIFHFGTFCTFLHYISDRHAIFTPLHFSGGWIYWNSMLAWWLALSLYSKKLLGSNLIEEFASVWTFCNFCLGFLRHFEDTYNNLGDCSVKGRDQDKWVWMDELTSLSFFLSFFRVFWKPEHPQNWWHQGFTEPNWAEFLFSIRVLLFCSTK